VVRKLFFHTALVFREMDVVPLKAGSGGRFAVRKENAVHE
jgi:hypothetical protein